MNIRDKEFADAVNLILNQVHLLTEDPCNQITILKACAATIEQSIQSDTLRQVVFNAVKPRD